MDKIWENLNNVVFILITDYEDGKYEINGVFKDKSEAEKMSHFLKMQENDFKDEGYIVKKRKIEEYFLL